MPYALSLACALIVIVSLLGGLLPLASILNHTRLQLYLSFAAGSMLGAAFFHMLPEAVRMGTPETIRWAAVGLLALFFLERFFSFHHHEATEVSTSSPHDHDHDHDGHSHHGHAHHHSSPETLDLSWGTATFGLAIHSLAGGVALASAIAADYAQQGAVGATGWGVFLATILHKPADSLTIVSLMIRSGVSRKVAHLVNLGFSLMIPVGVLLFAIGLGHLDADATAAWTAIALSFSAGTFLCIALSDLLPELHFHKHDRLKLSMTLLAGFLLMAGTSAIEMF